MPVFFVFFNSPQLAAVALFLRYNIAIIKQDKQRMKNKDKKHISEIALWEFTAAFAFVIFLMVFSSVNAQTSPFMPTLPIEGQEPVVSTVRPNTSLLSGDYSLTDHLSWNPISNAQALYNYASWNLLGTYSDSKNGVDYTVKKLDGNGSLQVAYNDPKSGADVTIAKNVDGEGKPVTLSSTESLNGSTLETKYFAGGGTTETFTPTPTEGDGVANSSGDGFARVTKPDGSYTIATVDSETGFDKNDKYDQEGKLIGTTYLSSEVKLPDGSSSHIEVKPLADDKFWVVPKTTAPDGTEKDGIPWIAQKDENGQLQFEKADTDLSGIRIKPDTETQYSGLKTETSDETPSGLDTSQKFQLGESSGHPFGSNDYNVWQGQKLDVSTEQQSSNGQEDFSSYLNNSFNSENSYSQENQPANNGQTSNSDAEKSFDDFVKSQSEYFADYNPESSISYGWEDLSAPEDIMSSMPTFDDPPADFSEQGDDSWNPDNTGSQTSWDNFSDYLDNSFGSESASDASQPGDNSQQLQDSGQANTDNNSWLGNFQNWLGYGNNNNNNSSLNDSSDYSQGPTYDYGDSGNSAGNSYYDYQSNNQYNSDYNSPSPDYNYDTNNYNYDSSDYGTGQDYGSSDYYDSGSYFDTSQDYGSSGSYNYDAGQDYNGYDSGQQDSGGSNDYYDYGRGDESGDY